MYIHIEIDLKIYFNFKAYLEMKFFCLKNKHKCFELF